MRDLTRYHRKVLESQTAERNRLLKLLETASIKLASVAVIPFAPARRHPFPARNLLHGWLKTIALLRQVRHRGVLKVDWVFDLAAAAYNSVRMRNLRKTAVQPA